MKKIALNTKAFKDLFKFHNEQSNQSRDLAKEGQERLKELTRKIHSISVYTRDVEKNIHSLKNTLSDGEMPFTRGIFEFL